MEDIITIQTKEKKKKTPFIAGIIILALAIVGVVNIAGYIIDKITPETDGSKQIAEYADFLTWVVGVDPDPFADITSANKDDLRNIALCSLMNDDVTTSTYSVTEKGMIVPAVDVEKYYASMFGAETPIVHGSVVGYGYEFVYDEGTASYYIPLTGVTPPFAVRIESATATGDFIELRVGYIGTSNVEVDAQGNIQSAQPDKYADIKLKRTDAGFNLISVMTITVGEHQ